MSSLATISEKKLVELTITIHKKEFGRLYDNKELLEKKISLLVKVLKDFFVYHYKLFPQEQENYESIIEIIYLGSPEKIAALSSLSNYIVEHSSEIIELMMTYSNKNEFNQVMKQYLLSKKMIQDFDENDAPQIARPKI